MRPSVFTLFGIAFQLAIALAVSSLWAQTPGNGAIAGTIVDPGGAVIPSAQGKVVDDATPAILSVAS